MVYQCQLKIREISNMWHWDKYLNTNHHCSRWWSTWILFLCQPLEVFLFPVCDSNWNDSKSPETLQPCFPSQKHWFFSCHRSPMLQGRKNLVIASSCFCSCLCYLLFSSCRATSVPLPSHFPVIYVATLEYTNASQNELLIVISHQWCKLKYTYS